MKLIVLKMIRVKLCFANLLKLENYCGLVEGKVMDTISIGHFMIWIYFVNRIIDFYPWGLKKPVTSIGPKLHRCVLSVVTEMKAVTH